MFSKNRKRARGSRKNISVSDEMQLENKHCRKNNSEKAETHKLINQDDASEGRSVPKNSISKLEGKRRELKRILKDNYSVYMDHLKDFYSCKISRNEFEEKVSEYVSLESAMIHYSFFLEFATEVRSASSLKTSISELRPYSQSQYIQSECSEQSRKIDCKSTNQQNYSRSPLLSSGSSAYRPFIAPNSLPKKEDIDLNGVKENSPAECCLPDLQSLCALMYIIAWENELEFIDESATTVILRAVEFHIRRIIMAVLKKKQCQNSMLSSNSGSGSHFNRDPFRNPTVVNEKEAISLSQLYDALQDQTEVFSLASLYSAAISRIATKLIAELKNSEKVSENKNERLN